jgi:hypothetical protein
MSASTSGRAASAAAAATTSLETDKQPILLGEVDVAARSGSGGARRWHQRFRLGGLHHCSAIPRVLPQLRLTTAPSG